MGEMAITVVTAFLENEEEWEDDDERISWVQWALSKEHKKPFHYEWIDDNMVCFFSSTFIYLLIHV